MLQKGRFSLCGFTLIELLVVIAILGILSTIGIGSFLSSQMKSRDARRKTDLKNIAIVLETYYNDKNSYPTASSGKIVGCGAAGTEPCSWGQEWAGNGALYMAVLPDDSSAYNYTYVSDGVSYALYARLENTGDPKAAKVGDVPGGYTGIICEGTTTRCNYVVASSNATLPGIVADGSEDPEE
ncbi:MAG: prepilin-type N-terminal cleavage/methylation domain-containing protein [Candidatus Pacebacteria bacterium]|nr:prepilin-type N-terminal cleavage/methylation domain-containing protein [Candidatus Paceibacterota bacterium]PIR60918.1 MAG: hypothetical protein COU67_00470 [Candidatus Pacebacteria bacterium CG10_big_fil_rev_8_21_14_0_10_44_54]